MLVELVGAPRPFESLKGWAGQCPMPPPFPAAPHLHEAFSQHAWETPASAERKGTTIFPPGVESRKPDSESWKPQALGMVGSKKKKKEHFKTCPCYFPSWSPPPPQLSYELVLPLYGSEKSTIWQFHQAHGLVSIQPTLISSQQWVCGVTQPS